MFGWFKTISDKADALDARFDLVNTDLVVMSDNYDTLDRFVRGEVVKMQDEMTSLTGIVNRLEHMVETLREDYKTLKQETTTSLDTIKDKATNQILLNERELAQASDEPWANINFLEFDPQKGFRFEGDWNDAFIDHLKASGFSGNNDEEIFQKYMARIALSISEKFEATQQAMDEANGKQSAFE